MEPFFGQLWGELRDDFRELTRGEELKAFVVGDGLTRRQAETALGDLFLRFSGLLNVIERDVAFSGDDEAVVAGRVEGKVLHGSIR